MVPSNCSEDAGFTARIHAFALLIQWLCEICALKIGGCHPETSEAVDADQVVAENV